MLTTVLNFDKYMTMINYNVCIDGSRSLKYKIDGTYTINKKGQLIAFTSIITLHTAADQRKAYDKAPFSPVI